ncbi:MAG: DUF4287 domain-containing protein [Caldilineaceae bacterium]|nr:DUF4287 domain-containing protein [Caldilineaceae bacterium]
MSVLEQAAQTQLNNIEQKTGKSLDELTALAAASGLSKHGQLRDYFKTELGLGYGDANALAHFTRQAGEKQAPAEKSLAHVVDELYAGKKAHLRPIHDALWEGVEKLGDFEVLPRQKYLSLRRQKQFMMIGPPTNTRVEVGLNVKDLPGDDRLIGQAKGSMCNYVVRLTDPSEVDADLLGWIAAAYASAG